ncbi:M20/M25/M40 family metallo-hydrolase, partial [Patulibacter sp. S7RM1-6]
GRAAARAIEAAARVAERHPGSAVTVGRLELDPNAPSVVPGRASFVVDVRSPELEDPAPIVADVVAAVRAVAEDAGLGCEIDPERLVYGPIAFDDGLLDVLGAAAREQGEDALPMVSPAGHDAGHLARAVPTAMLFVPCRGGVSHHPSESIEPEHATAATRVLAAALERLAA